uniref:Uncharacterized protein n=1 Tax=Agrobacterium vitis TaxID=373 RepID=A7XEG0_AGRVI|nr:hypothetical protein [Agrobacterium vitis]
MVSQSQTGRCSAVPRRKPEWAWALISPGISRALSIFLTGRARMAGLHCLQRTDRQDTTLFDSDRAIRDDAVFRIHGQQSVGGDDHCARSHAHLQGLPSALQGKQISRRLHQKGGGTLTNHRHRRMSIAGWNDGNDRGIGNRQPGKAMHPQPAIHHRHLITAHLGRTNRMKESGTAIADEIPEDRLLKVLRPARQSHQTARQKPVSAPAPSPSRRPEVSHPDRQGLRNNSAGSPADQEGRQTVGADTRCFSSASSLPPSKTPGRTCRRARVAQA